MPDLSAYPWLYLRDGEPLPTGEAAGGHVVELIAVGDVMLGRGVAETSGETSSPLADAASRLRAADLTVGNLESVIAAYRTPRPGPYRLRASPLAAHPGRREWTPIAVLRDAGFDVLGLANWITASP